MKKILLTSAMLLALVSGANAQSVGKLQPGNIWGNPSGVAAYGQSASFSAMFDSAFSCTTQGSVLIRGASLWTCTVSPTFITPNIGIARGTSLALGGATIGSNALAVTGTSALTSLTLGGATLGANNLAVTGTSLLNGAVAISGTSASTLAVGPNGATNPSFRVDASGTTPTDGILVVGTSTGSGGYIYSISSGTNAPLNINAKGTGAVIIGAASSGGVQLAGGGGGVAVTGALSFGTASGTSLALGGATIGSNALAVTGSTLHTGLTTVAVASPVSFVVGANGATNPVLQVDTSTSSQADGIKFTGAAAGTGTAVLAISSVTNSPLTINAKGTGSVTIGSTSTGGVVLGTGGGGVQATALTVLTSFTATGLVGYSAIATAALATQSQYFIGTSNVLVPASVIYSAETTTTFGATTTFDFNTFINTAVTLTGNITTQTLSNATAGKAGMITFIQDGTGSRTTVWNSVFKFAGGIQPTLSTVAGAVDTLFYSCRSSTYCEANLGKAFN